MIKEVLSRLNEFGTFEQEKAINDQYIAFFKRMSSHPSIKKILTSGETKSSESLDDKALFFLSNIAASISRDYPSLEETKALASLGKRFIQLRYSSPLSKEAWIETAVRTAVLVNQVYKTGRNLFKILRKKKIQGPIVRIKRNLGF